MTANLGVYTYPMHRDQHGWVKPSDCPFCAGETFRATQEIDAWEAARRNHPSNRGRTPGNLAYWDQVAAERREDARGAARALVFVVVTLARVLFLGLAVVGIAADVPVTITVLCGALMLALLPLVLPRKARRNA